MSMNHEHEGIDPHYWVSLNNYILMTEAINYKTHFFKKIVKQRFLYTKFK